jgi:energy-coupling factor transporter ATP-binding protein EcfA2
MAELPDQSSRIEINANTGTGNQFNVDEQNATNIYQGNTINNYSSPEREKANETTRTAYLDWVRDKTLYLDAIGTFQTQRQVKVPLDEVYVSLRAQPDDLPGAIERRMLEQEQEMIALEAGYRGAGKGGRQKISAEEFENRKEELQMRYRLPGRSGGGPAQDLSEVVARHERLVILGDPGAGKSTLLRFLALKHAQALQQNGREAGERLGPSRFPILLRIADYAQDENWKKQSLTEFLARHYHVAECPARGLIDLLESELATGNCLVLLDGLDEIDSVDHRRKVVERIEEFVNRHSHARRPNRFIVTSRVAGYRHAALGANFAHYTVEDMDDNQIRQFLEKWCTAVEVQQSAGISEREAREIAQAEIEAITRAVKDAPGVRRLATNPLLLRTLALIHRTGKQLPQKRVELYKIAADTLARTWRSAQGVPESALADERYVNTLLGKLAYWMHLHKPNGLATQDEVIEILGQEWANQTGKPWVEDGENLEVKKEVDKFLDQVRRHTGLFVERAPRRFGFMHLTFEEYYAARYLVARAKTRAKNIRRHLHDPRWEEPILLALGFVGLDSPEDAAELIETAILAQGEEAADLGFQPSPYEEYLARDYLFALRCLGDWIAIRPPVLNRLTERLSDELLHYNGLARFSRYQELLEERLSYMKGSETARELGRVLVCALNNNDSKVRNYAAQALGQLGRASPDVIAALLKALNDKDWSVRNYAVQVLGQLRQASPDVIAALLDGLANEEEQEVCFSIKIALGKLGQNETMTGLQEVLLKADDWELRQEAAKLLGEAGQANKDCLEAFYNGLLDNARNVQVACAEALGQLAHRFPEKAKDIVAYLIKALDDPSFGGDKKTGRRPDKNGIYRALVAVVSKMPMERG